LHEEGPTENNKRRAWRRGHGTIMGDYRSVIDRLLDPVKITG